MACIDGGQEVTASRVERRPRLRTKIWGCRSVLLVTAAVGLMACSPSPTDRLAELDAMFKAGGKVRAQMIAQAQPVDEANCSKMFVASGYSSYLEWGLDGVPQGFEDRRKAHFVAGCLALPKPGTSPSPSTVTSGTSGSASTSLPTPSATASGSPGS
jgi:hypothetical protein